MGLRRDVNCGARFSERHDELRDTNWRTLDRCSFRAHAERRHTKLNAARRFKSLRCGYVLTRDLAFHVEAIGHKNRQM